jgi:hypothetical protein
VASAKPIGSSLAKDLPPSSIFRAVNATIAIPTGMLSQKIHCQARPSMMAPPTSGPAATATPVKAPQIPSALPRRCEGVAAVIRASESGTQMRNLSRSMRQDLFSSSVQRLVPAPVG